MDILGLVRKTRTIRRFNQSKKVEIDMLHHLVEVARVTASARNIQPLKYAIITDAKLSSKIFDATGWAAAIEDGRPKDGERPTGYIIIYNDKNIAPNSMWDQGIVSYTMMMAATEIGLGGCIIATIYKDKFPDLNLPNNLEPVLVLALGYPTEDVRIVEMINGEHKYYRDAKGIHYVPKRKIEEILVKEVK